MKEIDFRELTLEDLPNVRDLLEKVFTQPPWNDDWSDREQLNAYVRELLEPENALCFGIYEENGLVAMSLGRVRHWWQGTEYAIDELCVRTDRQGQGTGTRLLEKIEQACLARNIHCLFLLTERNTPAFAFYRRRGFDCLTENAALFKCF